MPRILTSGPLKKPLPACGRRNRYQVPHSPFQVLCEAARVELDLSWNDIAKAIGKTKSTVWIWIHNENGYPAPRSCKPHHLEKLARVLKIKLPEMHKALDASRHIFTPQQNPVPRDLVDTWETLEATLEQVKRERVNTAWVLNLIRRLKPRAQPDATPPPAPAKPAPRRRR